MAIGWIGALKLIPWGTVLEAAPHIVKGAKTLIARSRAETPATAAAPTTADESLPESDTLTNLNRRLLGMEKQVVELSAEQRSSAELIRQLAEQNAEVVKAIEIFRIRSRILLITTLLSLVAITLLSYLIMIK